jgi:hypothetical protein
MATHTDSYATGYPFKLKIVRRLNCDNHAALVIGNSENTVFGKGMLSAKRKGA